MGVTEKILVSRMTSFAFVVRIGAVAPPVPFGSGQGPQPLLGDDTRRKNYAALNKEEGNQQRTVSVLPLAEASIAFVWTSAYAGAQTFAVCGALPHTLFFLNFLITPPFGYSYSLPFSVLCVAE